jgi:hypothetical protein
MKEVALDVAAIAILLAGTLFCVKVISIVLGVPQ